MFDTDGELVALRVARLHQLAAGITASLTAPKIAGSDGAAALDMLTELAAAGRQVELATVLLTEQVDRSGAWMDNGSRSVAAWVRNTFAITHESAVRQVNLGRALVDRMPATLAAWTAGELGMTQARMIAGAIHQLDDDLAAVIEQTLAVAAPKITTTDLRNLAYLIRQQAAPEQAADKANKDYLGQYVNLSKTLDGKYDLRGLLDPENGAIVKQALDAIINRQRRTGTAGTPDADSVPLTQLPSPGLRRALALVEMARQYADHTETCSGGGGGGRATIIVTIDHDTLTKGYGAGQIEGHGIISAAAVRRLACDAGIIAKTLGADGQTLDYGRRTRSISPALWTYLAARDGGCTGPGCDAPPTECEAHHMQFWGNGGETEPSNLPLACIYHHHLLHEGGWQLKGDAETELWWIPPDGSPPLPAQRHGIIPRAPDILDL